MLGYVDLPERVRVMGQMIGHESELPLGTPMELDVVPVGTDDNGVVLLGYRFVPASGTGADEEETGND